MQLWEFHKLLASQFPKTRYTLSDKDPNEGRSYQLRCTTCGWTILFKASYIMSWALTDKSGVSKWLWRHRSCDLVIE